MLRHAMTLKQLKMPLARAHTKSSSQDVKTLLNATRQPFSLLFAFRSV